MTSPDNITTVLVLGVGGNVGQGILKALAMSSLPCRVIGACITPVSAGLYMVEDAYLSPAAYEDSFLDWLIQTCNAEKVDVILSGVEEVLFVLAAQLGVIEEQTVATCIVSASDLLDICNDKLHTCRWLKEQGFNYPRFADPLDPVQVKLLIEECSFPLIAKPRRGKGSRGIIKIERSKDLDLIPQKSDYVIQQYLGNPDDEYTIGCFSDNQGQVRGAIVMKRDLLQGTTYRARIGSCPKIREEAIRIASALKPMGPCNVQLRLVNGRPTCFEINLRFSGTTPMRAHFGFNDVEACLRHFVCNEQAVDLPLITEGLCLRYWEELYIDPGMFHEISTSSKLNNPKNKFLTRYRAH